VVVSPESSALESDESSFEMVVSLLVLLVLDLLVSVLELLAEVFFDDERVAVLKYDAAADELMLDMLMEESG
jgi:hypothetical protein